MVGSAIVRALRAEGWTDIQAPSRADLDLLDPQTVDRFFTNIRPACVFMAAAKVGGILANASQPADFIYDNLMIEANVIHAAYRHNVGKLLLLGSTCIYPQLAPQPLREDYLMTGPLEPANEFYAIAKIAGIKLCQAYRKQYGCSFISTMPTNLYGPNDNFNLETAHVLPALIRKFHDAKRSRKGEVVLWGSGEPLREFLHVDDCAEACVALMNRYDGADAINIGVGRDISIRKLAELIARVVEFKGDIVPDRSKPDGTPRKLVDVGRIAALGWSARIGLEEGIRSTYAWYLSSLGE